MSQHTAFDTQASSAVNYVQSDGGKTIVLENAGAVFEGDYFREARDLKIVAPDGTTYKIIDYFAQANPPAILTTSGAMLDGATIEALAGPEYPGQYAQAAQSAAGAGTALVRIGKVQTIDGEATIRRADGTVIKLKLDEPVYQGDVVQTTANGKVSITFADGTVFAVSENARMVLDKLVYDPGGSSNSMLFNLIQGTFSFIAGKIASSGNMQVETPVATMGIRGTTVVATVEAATGATKFSLANDPDGTVGQFSIFNKQTGALLGNLSATDKSLFVNTLTSPAVEIPRDAAAERSAIDQIYRAYQDFQRRGDIDLDQNNQNNPVQKASLQSSGVSDAPNPADPLQSFQGSTVNSIAPLGPPALQPTLPGGPGPEAPQEVAATLPPTNDDTEPLPPAGPQPPVFNVPGLTLNVTEDGSVVVNGFSLSASNPNPITVTITAQSTVTLASTIGLTFTAGDGTADETTTFSGSATNIENALNGLTYFPTPNNDATGGLTISLDDGNFVVSATLSVNIAAVPDDPIANDDGFAVTEGNTLNGDVTADNGNGADIEPDTGDSFTVTELNGVSSDIGVTTTLSSGAQVTLQSDGTFAYVPSDSVADGQVFNDTFQYTIQDATGGTPTTNGTATATVTVAVTGVNDPPVVSAVTNPAAIPEGNTNVTTNVFFDLNTFFTASDVDIGETPAIDAGSINITANAASDTTFISPFVTFPSAPTTVVVETGNYDFLQAGQSAIVDVEFDIVSGADRVSRTIQITITGANDAPTVSVTNPAAVLEGDTGTPSTSSFNLVNFLTANDFDQGETPAINAGTIAITANGSSATTNVAPFSVSPTNATTIVVDTEAYDFLAAGQSAIADVTFDVVSGADTVSQTLQITVTGANDIPVVSAVSNPAAVPEGDDGVASSTTFDLTSFFTATDVDQGETPAIDTGSIAITANGASDTTNVTPFSVSPANSTTVVVDTSAYDFLDDGETAIADVTFNVVSGTDTVSRTVQLSVTGANDAPTVSAVEFATDNFSSFPNNNIMPSSFSGFNWPNSGNWLSFAGQFESLQNLSQQPNLTINRGGENFLFEGINIRAEGNQYTATLSGFRDGALVASQSLSLSTSTILAAFSGDVLVDTVVISDYRNGAIFGASAGAPKTDFIRMFIDNFSYGTLSPTGSIAGSDTGTVTEIADGAAGENTANLTANGSFLFADPETGDSHTIAFTPQAGGYIGTFGASLGDTATGDGTGRVDWNFTANDAALDSLAAGGVLTQSYDVSIDDGTAAPTIQTVTITINGTNDAPIVSAVTNPAAVGEGDTGTPSSASFDLANFFTASDIDNGETPAINTASIMIAANGASATTNVAPVTITPANSTTIVVDTEAYDFLAAGETALIDVTFDIVSGSDTVSRTMQISVTGANDAPVVSAISNPAPVPEGDISVLSNVFFNLNNYFTASDVDQGEDPAIDTGSIVFSANPTSDTAIISPFVNSPLGSTIIAVDTANYDFLNTGQQAIVDVTFDVVSGSDRVTRVATFTINGVTDGVISEDFEGGATGWIELAPDRTHYADNKTDATETAGFTEFLGRFSGTGGAEGIRKTFALSGSQDSITVSFDFYEINSWDGAFGEAFRVFTNGTAVINDQHQMNGGPTSFDHTISASSVADRGFPNQNGDPNFDQIWRYEFTLETSSANFDLGFGAILDPTVLDDESFGIDNLTIVENADTLLGTTGNDALSDDDGTRDVIRADAGDDIIQLEADVSLANTINANFTEIDGGTGQDTLRLLDAGDLDLTNINNANLQSIETIDLNNGQTNVLTLTLQDVLDLSETLNTDVAAALDAASAGLPLDHSDTTTLRIAGDSNDTVNFVNLTTSERWEDTGRTVNVSGEQHKVVNYVDSASNVLASVAVETDVATTGTT